MTTWSSSGERPRRYCNKPCPARRRTSRSTSLSVLRRPDANDASGRPVRSSWARSAAEPVALSSFRARASRGRTSGMGVNRIDLVFQHRLVPPPELYRYVVEPAGREAAIEMPQSRNDHPGDRDLDVDARLIEDEEIEARALGG